MPEGNMATRSMTSWPRTTLRSSPDDEAALFFLGKPDLNYVWLQLGPLAAENRLGIGYEAYALRRSPITHQFALIRLPATFAEGDAIPILPTDRWFSTREEAVAALPELLNQDE
jgi:hypothetical protein